MEKRVKKHCNFQTLLVFFVAVFLPSLVVCQDNFAWWQASEQGAGSRGERFSPLHPAPCTPAKSTRQCSVGEPLASIAVLVDM
ncbi:hypothetical protein BCD64_13505 [Nostoc sp. MBR 210]|nr:hypothetical protein BCD64_13505 [Nostoc sp. MBR 210]